MNRRLLTYIALEIPLALLSIVQWEFILISALVAVSYFLTDRRSKKSNDYELLAFAREVYNLCAKKGLMPALDSACSMPSCRPGIRELYCRIRLGDLPHAFGIGGEDRNLNSLAEIICLGVESGADIRNNLKLFISRLESEAEEREKAAHASLGMEMLSTAGIGFFVPLFGGIGASIISASGSIVGSSTAQIVQEFEILVLIYIAVMSFVSYLFGHGKKAGMAIPNSLSVTVIGAAIMRLSAAAMIYAI